MTATIDELSATLARLQATVRPRAAQDPRFQRIATDLQQLATTLATRQLTLHLVSADPYPAELLKAYLLAQPAIGAAYQITIARAPTQQPLIPQLPGPRLRLQLADRWSYISLDRAKKYSLGRASDCTILIPDAYLLVSGYHAEISYDSTSQSWQIRDVSRNGTFVNGQRLPDGERTRLAGGEPISLGSPQPTDTAPGLIFDDPLSDPGQCRKLQDQRPTFDSLGFLVYGQPALSSADKAAIADWKKVLSTSDLYVLMAISGQEMAAQAGDPPDEKAIKDLKRSLKTDLKLSASNLEHFFPGRLHPSGPPQPDQPHPDPGLQGFLTKLEKKAADKAEALLAKRLAPEIGAYATLIERLVTVETDLLSPQASAQAIDRIPRAQIYGDLCHAIQRIGTARKPFFDQARKHLDEAQARLFNAHFADSLPQKLQSFSRDLQPHVIKQKRRKILQLRHYYQAEVAADSETGDTQGNVTSQPSWQTCMDDANTAFVQVCENELRQWATDQWAYLCTELHGGGLQTLYQHVIDALAEVPYLNSERVQRSLVCRPLNIDYDSIFHDSFTRPPDEMAIKEPAMVPYLLKKVRSQWMQFIFLFSFFSILGIAGRRQIMRYLTAPVVQAFQTAPVIATLVIGGALLLGGRLMVRTFEEDREHTRKEQSNSLREGLCKHYQSLANKHFSPCILQALKQELEAEEERIATILTFLESQTNPTRQPAENRESSSRRPSRPARQSSTHLPLRPSRTL